jgi:hypothetical protein
MSLFNNSVEEITIQIDSEAAKAYKTVSPEEKKKIDFLISEWLKEITSKNKTSLKQFMDEMSDKAQARGLTSEILDAILSEE